MTQVITHYFNLILNLSGPVYRRAKTSDSHIHTYIQDNKASCKLFSDRNMRSSEFGQAKCRV